MEFFVRHAVRLGAVVTLFFALSLTGLAKDQGALEEWLTLEQTRIDRTVDEKKIFPPDIKNQKAQFRPESQEWFKLKSVWIPESELNVATVENLIPEALRSEFIQDREGVRYYRLFIHPESEKFYERLTSRYPVESLHEASSTASSRTVLVRSLEKPSNPYFVKLSLDVQLAGVVRTIPEGEVARSVGMTRYLDEIKRTSGVFKMMPEVVGISPKGWKRGGQIIRLVPDEVLQGNRKLVPLFSLYAANGNGPRLLETLAAKKGVSPFDFVVKDILKPFQQGWAEWAVRGSVVMEAHAQNVLLELDREGLPTGRFVHRDLGGFSIDGTSPVLDQELKARLPVFTSFDDDYHQKFSADAIQHSQNTYFEGGFLYNIDRELQRLDPQYKPGSIMEISRREAAQALSAMTGSMWVTPRRLVDSAPQIVAKARTRYQNGLSKDGFGPCLKRFFIRKPFEK